MGAPELIVPGTASGTAPVGGTGTTNTIPRWTGPSTLGDSGLIDDGSQIYTTSRVLAVNTATTLGTGLIRFQVGSASALANYQGAQAGFMLPTGSGSWVEFCENSASGTTFRISKDASTGVVLNANGKNMGFNASGYTTAVASSQMVLLTSGNVGIGTASPLGYANYVALNIGDNNAAKTGLLKFRSTYNAGNGAELFQATDGRVILNADGTGATSAIFDPTNRILNIAPASGWGLKLPATPGNTDPNTLDAYVDGGTAAAGGASFTATLKGSTTDPTTPVTTTGKYVLVGKVLTMSIYFDNVNTTGASGDVIIETNLAAALRPQMRSVGQVGIYNFNAVGLGTFADARTDGKIYIMCNQNNNVWTAATHSAGAGRYLLVTVTFIIG